MANFNRYREYRRKLSVAERVYLGRQSLHRDLPTTGGVYRITRKGSPVRTLYIGKAKNIRQRIYSNLMKGQIRSHTFKRKLINSGTCLSGDEKAYLAKRCMVQFIAICDSRERTFVEHYIIAAEEPQFND